jgi:hypothetical protein
MTYELEPVEQDIIANTTRYVGPLLAAAEVAKEFAAANAEIIAMLKVLQEMLDQTGAAWVAYAAEATAASGRVADAMGAQSRAAVEMGTVTALAMRGAEAAGKDLEVTYWGMTAALDVLEGEQRRTIEGTIISAQAFRYETAAIRDKIPAVAILALAEQALGEILGQQRLAIAGTVMAIEAETEALQGEARAASEKVLPLLALNAAEERLALTSAELAAGAKLSAAAMGLTANSANSANSSISRAGSATQRTISIFGRFALTWNQLHWILGVTFEVLAVVIPALIALGAGALVASQGAQNAYNHMTALWTAAESMGGAFHATMGTVLGFHSVLQQAQDAANPGVYEILGSAVNDVKASFMNMAGAGLQVVHMLDEFSARVTVDLRSGSGQVQSLLANMIPDLQQLGQVFGNLGHATLDFAAAMPGLAEVLLKIVDAISRIILWISQLPPWLIAVAMGFEEFYRYGGLVATLITRLGMLIVGIGPAIMTGVVAVWGRLGDIMGALVGAGATVASGMARVAGSLAGIVPGATAAETALKGTAQELSAITYDTAFLSWIGLAIGAMAVLAIALSHVKSSAQQMAAGAMTAVQAASDLNVTAVTAQQITKVGTAALNAQQRLASFAPTVIGAGAATAVLGKAGVGTAGGLANLVSVSEGAVHSVGNFVASATSGIPVLGSLARGADNLWASFSGANKAASDSMVLNQAQQQLLSTFGMVQTNISRISSYFHISGAAAEEMAQQAGVKLAGGLITLGKNANIAGQQLINLRTGLGAMAAPAGTLGNDMQALGIQSQLAGTKVQQLNQAWDQFLQTVTSGMSAFSQVQTALTTMGQDAASTSTSLTGSVGSISRTGAQMAYSLKGLSASTMQSWQQLTGALNTGGQALDFMRTGMAEGVVSGNQFIGTVRGLVGEFLPFVAGSSTATHMLSVLAQEAGGPATGSVKTLAEWAGVRGKAAANQFAGGIENATNKMSNMSQVAQNLSSTVSSQLDQALAGDIIKFSGVASAVQKYTQDLSNTNTPATTLHQDISNISNALQHEQTMQAAATQGMNQAQKAASGLAGTISGPLANALANYLRYLTKIPSHVTTTIAQNYVSTGYAGAGAAGHHVGGMGARGGIVGAGGIIPSFQAGGVLPGYAPGMDSIMAMLSPGEGVLNPYAVQAVGADTVHRLNALAGRGAFAMSGSGGGGGAAGGQSIVVHSHLYLDGKEIYTSVKQQNYKYGTRNAGARSGLMVPGTKT